MMSKVDFKNVNEKNKTKHKILCQWESLNEGQESQDKTQDQVKGREREKNADHYNEISYQNILICFHVFIIS